MILSTNSFADNPVGFENVLILENYSSGSDVFQTALDNLGITTYTSAYNGLNFPDDINDFQTYIDGNSDGVYDGNWDLIILNYDNALSATLLDLLNGYVQNGGNLIMTYQFVANFTTHPLWASLGFSPIPGPPIVDPINFVATDTNHDFFNTPNTIGTTFIAPDDLFVYYGHKLEASADGVQVAHLEGDSTKGLIITNSEKNTIFNSIQLLSFTEDSDNDSKADNIELAENEISSIVFNSSASVSETNVLDINVYPNPSNGIITVNLENKTNLKIFDINGKMINSMFLENSEKINIEKSGIYFLKFINNEGIKIEKLIIL